MRENAYVRGGVKAAAEPGAPRVGPSSPALVRLQRAVGNRAVARLVESRRQVSRDPTRKPPMPVSEPKGAPYAPPQKLTANDRAILEDAAGHRVDQAFTAFGRAVDAHAASIKAQDKFKAEMVAAAMDIFFGLAAPFFAQQLIARGTGAAKLAKTIGEKLSKSGVEGVKAVTDSDVLKESFKAVGKMATTGIKIDPTALFGETDVNAFATSLNDAFHVGVQAITDALSQHKLTDDQLIATWAGYDVEYTSETAYRAALKQLFSEFKTFVRPVGVHEHADAEGTTTRDTARVVWVSRPQGGRRLMLFEEHTSASYGALGETASLKELPDDIAPFAVAKTLREFGKIETLRMAWDPAPAPDPDSEPEMIRRHVEQMKQLKRQLDDADRRRKQQEVGDFIKQHPEWQVGSGPSTVGAP